MAATAAAPATARRERAEGPRRPVQLEERPEPLAPARGIAVAVALGALTWALVIAALLRF